ncbi:MAG: hypothetical protein EA420_16185 [Candidatus Competibacteraceae bacterium]|nr:MAG: hypothetical protein EA420_16185 [Candidatus Competibacteraceae bacterium]
MNLHVLEPRGIGRYLLGILAIPLLLLAAPSRATNADGPLFQQLAATVTAEAVAGQTVGLHDFATKARAAIDFMQPGGQLQGPYATSVARWSPAIAAHFASYLRDLYRDDLDALGSGWIDRILDELQAAGGSVARLSWGVFLDGTSHPFDSVAVFDPAGNLLFDTVLVHTITDVEVQPDDPETFRQIASVTSTDSKSVSGRFTVSNLGGTRRLAYGVTLRAEVAPYITTATNNAAMTMTANVSNSSLGTTGLFPPIANPQVYFGTGGRYQVINTDAARTPFRSRIWVSSVDAFQDGDYRVSGSDLGSGVSFDLSFGVSAGVASVSISIPGPGPLILLGSTSSAGEIFLGNVLYSDNAGVRYRGAFRNGGNFALRNFLIRTGDGAGEKGSVRASIPVYMAHEGVGVLSLTGRSAGTLSPSVEYVRGDHIRQPTYTVTADRETVRVGEEVTVTVRINNNSRAVALRDGSVALDIGSLRGILTPKSATVVNFREIATNGSESVTFVLVAERAGQVSLQADVDGRWGSPVPPEVTFRGRASLEIGAPPPPPTQTDGALESPQSGSFESGIGLVRGWLCEAREVEIQINDQARRRVAYGTVRTDTRDACGGNVNTGFGYTINWNSFGPGNHTLRLFVDDEEYERVNFTVTTLGVDFLRDVNGEYTLPGFPRAGRDIAVRWSEPHQNFVLADASRNTSSPASSSSTRSIAATSLGQLESPRQDSFESGIGLIRGWLCEARTVEVQINNQPRRQVAYGTVRGDTREACGGNANTGFGYTVNWSSLGDGDHTLRLFVDGEEFERVTFTVTTLGEDFLRGISGEYALRNFPQTGRDVRVRWSEPHQNFVIVEAR